MIKIISIFSLHSVCATFVVVHTIGCIHNIQWNASPLICVGVTSEVMNCIN